MPTSIVAVSAVSDSELQPLNSLLKGKCCIPDDGRNAFVTT
jgi:hypothetical protein